MDETKSVPSGATHPPGGTGQGGPLSQLTEKQPVASAPAEETDETGERPETSRPPSTGPADYASGTPEHRDDREV